MMTTEEDLSPEVYDELGAWYLIQHEYLQTDFSKSLSAFFQNEHLEIDQIVVMGLGPSSDNDFDKERTYLQISFIKQLAEILNPQGILPIYTTEPYYGISQSDHLPDTFNTMLEQIGFEVLPYDHEHVLQEGEEPYIGPAVDCIDNATFFYAPNLCSAPAGMTLSRSDPGYYLGPPMEFILSDMREVADNPIRRFKHEHVWSLLPVFDEFACDFGDLAAQVLYRRSGQGTWDDVGWNTGVACPVLPHWRRRLRAQISGLEASTICDHHLTRMLPSQVRRKFVSGLRV